MTAQHSTIYIIYLYINMMQLLFSCVLGYHCPNRLSMISGALMVHTPSPCRKICQTLRFWLHASRFLNFCYSPQTLLSGNLLNRTLGEKSDIPSSIRRNTVRNITDIPGYSVIFPWNIFAIRVIFRPEYVGINYTTYSEAEYYRNTHEKNIILWIISNEHFG